MAIRRQKAGEPSERQLRVAQEIHHIIAGLLSRRDFHHPVLDQAFVTITEVDISPDLRHARVYVCILNGSDEKSILDALNDTEGYFKTALSKQMRLKYLPRLRFTLDKTLDQAMRIHDLLRDAEKPKAPQD